METFNIAVVVLYEQQAFVLLTIEYFQVVYLVGLVNDFVQEKSCKVTF